MYPFSKSAATSHCKQSLTVSRRSFLRHFPNLKRIRNQGWIRSEKKIWSFPLGSPRTIFFEVIFFVVSRYSTQIRTQDTTKTATVIWFLTEIGFRVGPRMLSSPSPLLHLVHSVPEPRNKKNRFVPKTRSLPCHPFREYPSGLLTDISDGWHAGWQDLLSASGTAPRYRATHSRITPGHSFSNLTSNNN